MFERDERSHANEPGKRPNKRVFSLRALFPPPRPQRSDSFARNYDAKHIASGKKDDSKRFLFLFSLCRFRFRWRFSWTNLHRCESDSRWIHECEVCFSRWSCINDRFVDVAPLLNHFVGLNPFIYFCADPMLWHLLVASIHTRAISLRTET